jgi:hypothetical protein
VDVVVPDQKITKAGTGADIAVAGRNVAGREVNQWDM